MLADGYHDLPPGKLAAVVTFLEMTAKPQPLRAEFPAGLSLEQITRPDLNWYRALYTKIGAPWLWSSRLELDDEALRGILHDPDYQTFALRAPGGHAGLLELDFRQKANCELAYFGLSADLIGQGTGRALMSAAIQTAWSRPVSRFWVHTCTLDSPGALEFYLRSGFKPYKRAVEVMDDPRLTHGFDPSLAPFAPIIR